MAPTPSTAPTPLRAAIYARISLDLKEGAGVERQIADCRKLAELHGWDIAREYVDNDTSAWSGVERPAYRDLLADIRAGRVDQVVVWHTDRLARRTRDTLDYLEVCKVAGVQTFAVQGNGIDPTSADGEFLATILAAIAQQESTHKGERVRAAQEAAARAGEPRRGGPRTFGYESDGETIVEREAYWLREAAQRVLAGVTVRKIARDMNDAGITTTRGKPMSTTVLRNTLMTPRIAALATWNPRRPDGTLLKSNREIVGKGQWPAILDEDTFNAVCAVLTDPSRKSNRRGNKPAHLLSGIVRCGGCGLPMYINIRRRNGKETRFYYCKGSRGGNTGRRDGTGHTTRTADKLEGYVSELVLQRLEQTDVVEQLALSSGQVDRVAELTGQRDQLRTRLEALDEQVAFGTISVDRFARIAPKVEQQIAEIGDQLAELAGHDNALSVLRDVTDVRAWWASAELDLKRTLINTLVNVVVQSPPHSGAKFDPAYVDVSWKAAL
ncbi:MAG: recombinase family protein [Corynebacterium sp.]|uniref:recombinase family protein n=1 Tax=Corynebacterium sp. TaxID=1720 RepID=UPI003F011D3F